MKRIPIKMMAMASLVALVAAGCGAVTTSSPGSAASKSSKSSTPVIGMTLMTLTNPYFAEMGSSAKADAAKMGMKLEYEGANFSQATQLSQVDAFIQQHVSAVMIAPADAGSAGTLVLALNKAHIPVFTIDTNVEPSSYKSQGGHVVEFVQSNNYKAGVIAGEEMVQYLHGQGHIGWLDFPLATSVLQRDAGFESVIKKYPGIKVVSRLNGEGTTPGGLSATADMLEAHPHIKAIFDINAPCGLGAVDAITAAHKVGQVAVIGLSGSEQAVSAIENNSVYKYGVMQEPELESDIEIHSIYNYLHGKKVKPLILTSVFRITKQDAAHYAPLAYK